MQQRTIPKRNTTTTNIAHPVLSIEKKSFTINGKPVETHKIKTKQPMKDFLKKLLQGLINPNRFQSNAGKTKRQQKAGLDG